MNKVIFILPYIKEQGFFILRNNNDLKNVLQTFHEIHSNVQRYPSKDIRSIKPSAKTAIKNDFFKNSISELLSGRWTS